jgi:metal-responsive CopG/Arc/MetJ family transcriptional regulator
MVCFSKKVGDVMSNSIVLELPERVQQALDEAVREEGQSPNELVVAALEDYLFIRKFRRLRERMLEQAEEKYTDDDIFERIS